MNTLALWAQQLARALLQSLVPAAGRMTRVHSLDGARYLLDARRAGAMLCRLVARHSCAIAEAGERGLAGVLCYEFEPAPDTLASVLTFCDMITSPDGEIAPAGQRLAEIQHRHGPGAPGEPVDPARHADDPQRGQAGPQQSRPYRMAPRAGADRTR